MQIHFEEHTAVGVVDVVRMREVVAVGVVQKADVVAAAAAAAVVAVERRTEALVTVVGRMGTVEAVHRMHDWQDMDLALGQEQPFVLSALLR